MIELQSLTERILLSALREQDAADAAEHKRADAQFLADVGLELHASLDEESTYAAIANLTLPRRAAWCIVDVVEPEGVIKRVAVIHPDPLKHAAALALVDHWTPAFDDLIGVPALGDGRSTVALADRRAIATAAERSPDTGRVVEWLGAGPVLVVPLLSEDGLLGAITFVGSHHDSPFTEEEIAHSEAMAARCAQALAGARRFATVHETSLIAEASRADAEVAREVAESANNAKDGAIAMVSHELRSPLGAIANNIHILQLEVYGPVTTLQRAVLDRIATSHAHVMALVDQLLDLQRIAVGKMHFEMAPVSVVSAIVDAADMATWHFTRANVQLELGVDETLGELHTDRRKFTQIILNLLANAAKFTPTGGRVLLSAERLDAAIRVRVSDTGIGIAVDNHEAVFEPFVQVRDAAHQHSGGAGLGLAISRQFARGLGGDLTVESAPGKGSTFTLAIPDTRPEAVADGTSL
ncbi:HAMP domain-containing sensor histidine kinase [Gemmatimonas sp.]|uniref:GAF domain-containing sensor histidine kinase n=1 Tax=Gemmatimonas sp. TaxID=1962908 RepID=UPI00286D0C9D|nr:HAMP domain-containing sensor histidine kinase [Gemmatimonas sp.]